MKTLVNVILFSLLTSVGFSQVQSSCEKSWGLENYYEREVAFFAFERMYETNSPDTNKIIIPQVYQDSIWRGLSAIYNAFSIEQRDSVFDIYCLHNTIRFGTPIYPAIIVELDTTFEWTNNWMNGEIITGYEDLDSFINEYNYSIEFVYENLNKVVINTDFILNPNPFMDSLIFFDGISIAFPSVVTSDGNKIEYSILGDEQFFDFTLAWGDCLSGCTTKHKWSFKVNYSTCVVEYLGLNTNNNGGFPNPANCNITAVEHLEENISQISIYPNPSSNFLNISCENIINIEISNGQRILEQKQFNKQKLVKLDLTNLKSGLYIIKVNTEKELFVRKFIKK